MHRVNTLTTKDRHPARPDRPSMRATAGRRAAAGPPAASGRRRAARPVGAVEPAVAELRHAARCGCVEPSLLAYRNADGDLSCARCGRQLPATAGGADARPGTPAPTTLAA